MLDALFLVIMCQTFYTALFSQFALVALDLSQSCPQYVSAQCSSGQVSDSLLVALAVCLRSVFYCNVKHDSMSFVAFAAFFLFFFSSFWHYGVCINAAIVLEHLK